MRDALHGQDAPEQRGHAEHDDDAARRDVGQLDRVPELDDLQLTGDARPDEQGVEHRHHRSLHRRADPGVNTAEDDDRGHQGEEILAEHGPEMGTLVLVHGSGEPGAAGKEIGHEHHHEPEHEARHEPGGKQRRDGCIGDDAIDDHRVARWDQDAEGAARGAHASRVFRRIAAPDHRGDHDAAHGGDRARARADHGGEEQAAQNGGDAEAAAYPAHEQRGHVDDLAGHAALFHERAREDEAHHGEQREHVHHLEHVERDDAHGDIGQNKGKGGGHAERHENGAAHDEAEGHNNPKNGIGGHATPPPAVDRGWKRRPGNAGTTAGGCGSSGA